MCTNTDDVNEEYLDDPISLVAIENIKTEICDDGDQIIEVSSDEEETCTSAYGKKNFVLPVTFFDKSRNVRLLNKCKPLSIRIVDCKQYPTHYTKCQEKCRNKSDESCVEEVDSQCKSDKETKPSNVIVEDIAIIASTKEKADKKQEKEKRRKHSDSFYQKLKLRKEKRKQIALNCKGLSQVDFKRNIGLVGMKITDIIFKQIVDSEKALLSTKCNSLVSIPNEDNIKKSEYPPIATKTIATNIICKDKYDSVAENALAMRKSLSTEKNNTENNQKDLSESEKTLLSTTKTNSSDDKFKEKIPRVSECLSIKKPEIYTGNKFYDKKENDKEKAYNEHKSIHTDKNKSKEKSKSITGKDYIETKVTSVVIKCNEKMPMDAERALIGSNCNFTTATEATKEKPKNREFEGNKYMKKVGATLENLGTSVILLTKNHTDHNVPKHVSPQANSGKASTSQNKGNNNLDSNKEGSQIRCSLNILSNKVIKKVLKVKKPKPHSKNISNTVFQQNPKELHSKVDQTGIKINLKQSKPNTEGFCVSFDCGKMLIKRTNSKEELEKDSDGARLVDIVVVKDARRDRAGPKSPVIPCTTIPVRAATPKLTSKLPLSKVTDVDEHQDSTAISATKQANTCKSSSQINIAETESTPSVQKQSSFPNVSLPNKTDASNTKCTVISKHQTVTEFKYPKSHTLAALSGFQNNIPAMTKRSLSHHNLSNINPTKGTNLENAPIKPASSGGNLTINGLVNNQANPNQQINTPLTPRIPSNFSGDNAIILKKSLLTPPRQLLHYPSPNRGQPIQTVVDNRLQYQPISSGPRPPRFHHPPPCPPPPPPPTPPPPPPPPTPPNVNKTLTQVMSQQYITSNRVPPTVLRGNEMGLDHWRFYNPLFPPVNRPPLSVPRPPSPQVNEDSFIGNTANGDPIKKINIPVVPKTVEDKQKMLAELNDAMLSPELTNNQDNYLLNHLKRKAGTILIDPVTPKHSKPGPLSKKIKTTPNRIYPDKSNSESANIGYSPPILPILPYQESFRIFSSNDSKKANPNNFGQNCTPLKRTTSTGSIKKLDKDHKRLPHQHSGKQEKAKKITYEDYRKRVIKQVVDGIDDSKIRKYKEPKNVADDFNQDQGYDSDSTVKL